MKNIQILHCAQKSDAWLTARRGRLTGSCADDIVGKLTAKSKEGPYGHTETASWRDLRSRLALERVTERSYESTASTFAMRQGIEREPHARAAFELFTKQPVFETGFLAHESLSVGASLDGHLGDFDELVSIKCRDYAEHYESVRFSDYKLPRYAQSQMIHELWLTGAKAHHYVLWNPDMPERFRLKVVTLKVKDIAVMELLGEYERTITAFLSELDKEADYLRGVPA